MWCVCSAGWLAACHYPSNDGDGDGDGNNNKKNRSIMQNTIKISKINRLRVYYCKIVLHYLCGFLLKVM